jgi:hypothetical protein
LNALLKVCVENSVNVADPLVLQLKKINEELWKIEDDIRDKEMAKAFDPEFVALARAVYVTNDKRFEVKKEINLKMGSGFVEEKSYKQYL